VNGLCESTHSRKVEERSNVNGWASRKKTRRRLQFVDAKLGFSEMHLRLKKNGFCCFANQETNEMRVFCFVGFSKMRIIKEFFSVFLNQERRSFLKWLEFS
jgi:hypothetical protein